MAGVACGSSHCLAVTSEGELYSWGCDLAGQCGLGGPKKGFGSVLTMPEFIGTAAALFPLCFLPVLIFFAVGCAQVPSAAISSKRHARTPKNFPAQPAQASPVSFKPPPEIDVAALHTCPLPLEQ